MADTLTFQSSTLATIPDTTVVATDDVGGVHYQLVKLVDGTADGATVIKAAAGTAANALRVTIASDSDPLIVKQATAGNLNATVVGTGTFTTQAQQSGTWTVQPGNTANTTAWKVDGSAVTQPVSGTFWQATQPVSGTVTAVSGTAANLKVEAVGTGTFAVQADTELTTADLDTGAGTDTRAVVGLVFAASGGATLASAANPYPVTVVSGASNTQFAEDVAHTTGDVGTMALAVQTATPVARQADGDYAPLQTDADGKLWVNSGTVRARKLLTPTTITASTSETTIIAAVASESHDLYGLTLTNTGTTATKVSLRDDTAGTVKWVLYVPAGATVGFTLPVDSAIPQTAQNKNWTATCASSTSSLEVTALYIKVT